MKVILGADHGGFVLKETIKRWLVEIGIDVEDVGAEELSMGDDYVDHGIQVARELERGEKSRGLLFCRNGFGMMITANRFSRVRCGLAFDVEAVKRGRRDDDINCLAVPADYIGIEKTKQMIKTFLEEPFSEEDRYKRRLDKLEFLR